MHTYKRTRCVIFTLTFSFCELDIHCDFIFLQELYEPSSVTFFSLTYSVGSLIHMHTYTCIQTVTRCIPEMRRHHNLPL